MSWLATLSRELAARGVIGGRRRRIELELSDHIACEPGGEQRLGDPTRLAATFADELATDGARRSAYGVFGALAITALAVIVSQLSLRRAGGYPGFNHGLSMALFIPALLGMVVASQAALVAGTLAAWRARRRRRARVLPSAEIALIRRRTWVAVGAGFAVVAGLELYVIDFARVLPAWWLVLTGGLAAIAGGALLVASVGLARGGTVVSAAGGPAGDVFDDLPVIGWSWLRGHPWRLAASASLAVGLAMTVFVAHAERSWVEGLERGGFEALVAVAGFALLGRAIGVATPLPAALGEPIELADVPSDRLIGDHERAQAELLLRESFGSGRLELDELTARVAAVHGARTAGQLRGALRGLPPTA